MPEYKQLSCHLYITLIYIKELCANKSVHSGAFGLMCKKYRHEKQGTGVKLPPLAPLDMSGQFFNNQSVMEVNCFKIRSVR